MPVCAWLPASQNLFGESVAVFGLCHQLALRHSIRKLERHGLALLSFSVVSFSFTGVREWNVLGIHIIPSAEEFSPHHIAGIGPVIMLSDDLFLSGQQVWRNRMRIFAHRKMAEASVRSELKAILCVSFLGAETRDLGLGRGTQGVCPNF